MRACRPAIRSRCQPAHRFWPYEQPDLAQQVAGEPVRQGSDEGPSRRGEPHLLPTQLALEDGGLVAQGEALGVFGLVTHRQQPQHRESVGHAAV
jgi:hypothetical protein